VFRNGHLVRKMPTTGGAEPKYTTRSGVKVIVEKDRFHDMNSETIGIDPNSADGYNLKGVEYAMRLTYSGEFIHAAPWSVGSQGHANVSHGCTGLSTANAGWLYQNSLIGDPVEYSGTDKPMTLTNGYGDWNESFAEYAKGSAL
jgi:lipoprotein-anchoring transpeptidase ErfK/SrfK